MMLPCALEIHAIIWFTSTPKYSPIYRLVYPSIGIRLLQQAYTDYFMAANMR